MLKNKVVAQRNKIIKQNDWKIVKIFDTNENEQDKDVALIKDSR